MNLRHTFSFLLGMFALLTGAASVQDAANVPKGPNIFVELLIVAVPNSEAVPLVIQLNDTTTRKDGTARLRELLKMGVAKVVGWPTVTTRSGERASVEAGDEVRYATEYSAGGVGIYYNKEDGSVKKEEPVVHGSDFHAVPSAFETRNIGVSFEIEPKLDANGTTVQIQVVAQHIRLSGMKQIAIEKPNTQEKVVTEQPLFERFNLNMGFAMESGEQVLVGVFPATEPAGHLELMLLRTEVRKPQKP